MPQDASQIRVGDAERLFHQSQTFYKTLNAFNNSAQSALEPN